MFKTTPPDAADILDNGAQTYRERNAVYGDNFRNVGGAMAALHPRGLTLETAQDFELFHLHMLMVVKLSRFANSMLLHRDSIHDIMVYAAMCESILAEREARDARARLAEKMAERVDGGEKEDVTASHPEPPAPSVPRTFNHPEAAEEFDPAD